MKDFKELKIYQQAVQSRDWQLCETISNNPELYILRELIERIKPVLIRQNHFMGQHYMEYGDQGDWQIMEQADKIIEEIL